MYDIEIILEVPIPGAANEFTVSLPFDQQHVANCLSLGRLWLWIGTKKVMGWSANKAQLMFPRCKYGSISLSIQF